MSEKCVNVTAVHQCQTRSSAYNFTIPICHGPKCSSFYYISIKDWNNLSNSLKSIQKTTTINKIWIEEVFAITKSKVDENYYIYTQKNNWRILKFFWLYSIWEYYFQTNYFRTLIDLSLYNSPKCKLKFTGHWLRYSTTPNVPTLSTQSSQVKNLALSIFAATFTRSLLMF